MQLTWLGHSAFHLDIAGNGVLIDPFWTGIPSIHKASRPGSRRADFIVLTTAIPTTSATARASPKVRRDGDRHVRDRGVSRRPGRRQANHERGGTVSATAWPSP
jgi:L-ascorbate metabolism protein UlaG (beta-lactamase superfamily)